MHTKTGRRFCRMRGAGKIYTRLWEVVKRGWRKGKSCGRAIGTASAGLKVTNRLQMKPGVPFPYGAFAHRAEAGRAHGAGGEREAGGYFRVEGKGWQPAQLSSYSATSVRFAAHHSCLPSHARLDKRIYLANSKKCSLRRHIPGRQAGERKRCFDLFGQRVLGEEIGVERTNRRSKSIHFLPLSRLSARRRDPGPGGQRNKSPGAESSAESGARSPAPAAGGGLGARGAAQKLTASRDGARGPRGSAPRRQLRAVPPPAPSSPLPRGRPAQLPRRQRGAALTCGARVGRRLRRGGRRKSHWRAGSRAARCGATKSGAHGSAGQPPSSPSSRGGSGQPRGRGRTSAGGGASAGGAGRGAAARGSSRRRHSRAAGGAAPRAEGSRGAVPGRPKGSREVAGGSLRALSFGFSVGSGSGNEL